MKYEAIHDRVLIKPDPASDTISGILMLDKEKDVQHQGTVVAVGKGVPLHNIKLNITGDTSVEAMTILERIVDKIENGRAMRVAVGDRVIYGKYAGTKIKLGGEEFVMIREGDVFMKEKNL